MTGPYKSSPDHILLQAKATPLPASLPSLLSLPDHLLKHIGTFIDEDNTIAYPAYGPSWQNLVAPSCSLRPLRDHRAVCHRIRQVVDLTGTWLVIKTMADLQKYAWVTSDGLLRSVSRLKLRIDSSFNDTSSNGVISIVSHLIRLLQRTPNLRELRVARPIHAQTKHHAATKPLLTSLILPRLGLPKLEHVYVKISCEDCASGLEPFIGSLTPNLRSLKMYLPDTKGFTPLQDTFRFAQERFRTPMIKLEKLFLRVGPGMDYVGLLRVIARGSPALKEYVSAYDKKEMRLNLAIRVPADDGDGDVCKVFRHAEDNWSEISGFEEALMQLKELHTLDMGFTVQFNQDSQLITAPVVTDPIEADQLPSLEIQQAIWQSQASARQAATNEANIKAAEYLVQACPTLRQGWWWDCERTLSTDNVSKVYRRQGWSVTWLEDEVEITMDEGALRMTDEFVNIYG